MKDIQMKNSLQKDLPLISECHLSAFPEKLSSRLGRRYTSKILEWYLVTEQAFLFHAESKNKVLGYCGALITDGTLPVGSASGMAQHSFFSAIGSFLIKPWLLLQLEIIAKYKFVWRNILYKTGIRKVKRPEIEKRKMMLDPRLSLVVIGVNPHFQHQGIGSMLITEFEQRAISMSINNLQLSVQDTNLRAIKFYQKHGWTTESIGKNGVTMVKKIEKNTF